MPLTHPKTNLFYLRSEKAKAEQKLRSCQHREKILERQMSELNRRERVHRLCTRAGMLESFLVCPGELTDDQVMELLKISFRQPEVVLALAKMVHAEFSALQSSSAELRTQLETLQPDISALKNIRKYIDMVLNKQQLSAPNGKTSEKESVLKKLEEAKAAQSQKKAEQKNHTQEL